MQIRRTVVVGLTLAGMVLLAPWRLGAAEMATEPSEPNQVGGSGVDGNGDDVGSRMIMLNFQDAPLQTILEYLSETAGLTIVSPNGFTDGRMTVIRRTPISVDGALRLINEVLKERDLTTVRQDNVLTICSLDEAIRNQIPVIPPDQFDNYPPGADMATYVIPVQHINASGLQQNLMALLPEYATIEANEDSNTLIITDTTANVHRLMQIIRALDTHMSSVAEIEVFRLYHADATSAANLINSVFRTEGQTLGNGGNSNIMQMMMGGRGGRGGRGGNDNNSRGGGSSGGSVGVGVVAAADSRTNSVVVRASTDILAVIRDMLNALDDQVVEQAQVRVVQLRYADALNVADVVNQLFGDQTNSRSSNQRGGARANFGRGGRGGMMGGTTGGQSENPTQLPINAAADSQTNNVIVTGPAELLDVVVGVIKDLDTQIPNEAVVQVYRLEYADATNVASLIVEIFTATNTSSRNSRTSQNRQVQFGRGGRGGQTAATGGSTSDVAVAASADPRTNSVVVTAAPDVMPEIQRIISDLDKNPEQERQIFVYPLKNGTSGNLVTILNSMFEEMQALNQQGTGRTGGQQFRGTTGGTTGGTGSTASGNDLSEETYFEADEETNSLLVMTSTKNYEKIKPILDQLDKQVGQVLIKCLFAEITHSNNVDLGTEFSAWNLRGAGDSNNVEVSTAFGAPAGGLVASVFDNTLEVTIRALQDTGKLNILSRPYILASNQQEASIIVGNRVPFATGTTTVAGQTQITTEYQDVGISLSVTPSINPEGLVIMTVSPEISSTTGDEIRVSNDLSLPVFATRSSTTKVAVRDGQTIVIGGLIQDEIRDTVSKVPVLGDIPVLGHLFKRTQKDKTKTELLIFLTPHVAPDALALQNISDAERRRSNLGKDPAISDIYRGHLTNMGAQGNVDAHFDYDDPNEPNEP